jgi:DNA-binding winged helix-turn-helix (wHTH) protein/Tol biopolymer transport system component
MPNQVGTSQVIRFATFEVDLQAQELRKAGLRLKLTGQPFQVLAILLEQPGFVVTREELQKRLWPDTFVDVDHNLNTAINKIREALGDSAEEPKFVETLPRRGYRFIAPVEGKISAGVVEGTGDEECKGSRMWPRTRGSGAGAAPAPVGVGTGGAGAVLETPLRERWPLVVAGILVALAAAVLGWYAWQRSRPKPELTQRQLTTNSSELAVLASAISPDGRYLAYSDDGGIHLRVVDTAETHALPTPPGATINKLAWFPEGNKLLASGEAGQPSVYRIWTISILGGPLQTLRDDAWDGSVFQNGRGIVFVSGGQKQIWQMSPEGEEPRKLTTASKGESFATPVVVEGRLWYARGYVSPASAENVSYDIESRDLNGGPRTILVSDLDWRYTTLLLPNGRFIYSRWDRRNLYQNGSLWEIQADLRSGHASGKPRRIAGWPDFEIASLSASADGKRLAFVREQRVDSVYVSDLDGNGSRIVNPRRLTLSDSFDHPYAWTPDSGSVLFDSNRNGTWNVFKQALNQRTAEKLVASPGGSMRPAMSPDRVSVLYLTAPPPSRIMRAALTGGPPQSLGDIQDLGEIRCALTVNLCVVSESSPKQKVLYALDPVKGKSREPLSTGPPINPAQYFEADWDVSPDGSSLAFITSDVQKNAFQIQIRPVAGGAGRELNISGWGTVDFIRWAADGKGWYVTALSASASTLLKVDPTGKAQQVLQGSTWANAIPSPDGRHVAMIGLARTSNVWMFENF